MYVFNSINGLCDDVRCGPLPHLSCRTGITNKVQTSVLAGATSVPPYEIENISSAMYIVYITWYSYEVEHSRMSLDSCTTYYTLHHPFYQQLQQLHWVVVGGTWQQYIYYIYIS